ncbi:MAG TPA: GNAT family N-acetyltransferase [Streptosporangiaceae bacterium]|nr:GNAT family N-acetyltransferase [Streptosporangiaceae bacterium]
MDVERFAAGADPASAQALYEVYLAGAPGDEPGGPPMSPKVFIGLLSRGWCLEPRENWLARVDGVVAGGYSLELPDREDLDRAALRLLVAPGQRRAGLGRELLRHAADRARELGRRTLSGGAQDGSPGDRFARAVGARFELAEVRRRLDLAAIAPGHLAALRKSAEEFADGYTLRDWDGLTPDDLLGPVARLNEVMNDAPALAGAEDQHWDGDRVLGVDQMCMERGLRRYSIAALDGRTGELAALTQLSVDETQPLWGHQEMTAVDRPHRGHRLGLLTKVAMLELLARREPRVASTEAWNAEANVHMVAINEALGYRPVARKNFWARPTAGAGAGQS